MKTQFKTSSNANVANVCGYSYWRKGNYCRDRDQIYHGIQEILSTQILGSEYQGSLVDLRSKNSQIFHFYVSLLVYLWCFTYVD